MAQLVKNLTAVQKTPVQKIPGSGRSHGEGIGYPLHYSQGSLMAQTAKNQPAMLKTWVQSLGWEYPLEEGMVIHSSNLSWRISMGRGAWWATVHGLTELDTTELLKHSKKITVKMLHSTV